MSRANIPEHERQDFALYVDEFQNFSTDSFATILSEARKFHLNLIVANQFTTQLTEEIRDAVFGNIGTVVCFRIGQNDVESLSRYFQPQFDGDDLLRIPNANTVVRTLVGGVPTQPFSMATLPPLGNPNKDLADALKQLSAAKYGKPRAVVEKEIFGRLETRVTPSAMTNPFASPAGAGGTPNQFAATPPRPAQPNTNSFLDEWVAKQQVNPGVNPPQNSVNMPASTASPAPMTNPFTQSQPAPVSQPPAQPSYAAGNISSAQLDQKEVDDIAGEIKKNLAGGSAPAAPVQKPSQEADIPLQTPHEGDEISIDNDGTIHTTSMDTE